jgi:hypothetical protein
MVSSAKFKVATSHSTPTVPDHGGAVHQVVPNLEKKSKSGKYFLKSDRGSHGFRGLGLSDCGAAW